MACWNGASLIRRGTVMAGHGPNGGGLPTDFRDFELPKISQPKVHSLFTSFEYRKEEWEDLKPRKAWNRSTSMHT